MRNWDTLEADTNLIMGKHFNKGRAGQKIRAVVLHHNAGNLSIKRIWETWQTRPASAHYQVEQDGKIGQLVWDSDTAWHAGTPDPKKNPNPWTIGIEHANNGSEPWTISEATLDNGAHLTAAICKFYGLGRPTWGVNVFGHRNFVSTACPGEIAGSQNAEYMARTQKWYDEMTGTTPAPAPAPTPAVEKPSIDKIVDEVINGAWGNDPERSNKLRAAGHDPVQVQALVNQKLLGHKTLHDLAREVIEGKWGNDPERSAKLRKAGYKPYEVQKVVNQMLGA